MLAVYIESKVFQPVSQNLHYFLKGSRGINIHSILTGAGEGVGEWYGFLPVYSFLQGKYQLLRLLSSRFEKKLRSNHQITFLFFNVSGSLWFIFPKLFYSNIWALFGIFCLFTSGRMLILRNIPERKKIGFLFALAVQFWARVKSNYSCKHPHLFMMRMF